MLFLMFFEMLKNIDFAWYADITILATHTLQK